MYVNPHGYYYAPASLYFSGRSSDSDSPVNKRIKKQRRKSKGDDGYERHEKKHKRHRVRSAYINNRIPLHIIPARVDNKNVLHAYPIKDPHHAQKYGYDGLEYLYRPKEDPMYVKKLEYSADKLSVLQKHKSSEKKKKNRNADRSMEIDNQNKDYFTINKNDRKNTLSGHKRTFISN